MTMEKEQHDWEYVCAALFAVLLQIKEVPFFNFCLATKIVHDPYNYYYFIQYPTSYILALFPCVIPFTVFFFFII